MTYFCYEVTKTIVVTVEADDEDASRPNGHLLRQVRNQFGPKWLEEYR